MYNRSKEQEGGSLMKSKKLIIFILFSVGLLVLGLGFYGEKYQLEKSTEELDKYDYVVSSYSYDDQQTKLFFLNNQGQVREHNFNGFKGGRLYQEGKKIYVYSFGSRLNEVFHGATFSTPYFGKLSFTKYATLFVTKGEKGRIEGLSVEDGKVGLLTSRLRYTNPKNNELMSPTIDLGLSKALEADSKIFVTGFDLPSTEMYFLYLDEETNELKRLNLNDPYQSDFQELLMVDEKVMTVGNPNFTRFDDEKKREEKKNKISLASVDPKTLEVKEETYEAKRVLFAYPFKNRLRFLTSDYRLVEYSSDLKAIAEKDLSATELAKFFSDADSKVQAIRYVEDKLIVLMTPAKSSSQAVGIIAEFDADNLTLKNQVIIPLSEHKEWKTEFADLLVLEDR